jgi:hypothetical protein
MHIIKTFTPTVLLVAMALAPLPAAAQERRRPGGAREGQAVASDRGQAPRQQDTRAGGGAAARGSAVHVPAPGPHYSTPGPQSSAPRQQYATPRQQYSAPRQPSAAPHQQYSAPRPEARGYAVPRPNYGPSYGRGPSYGYAPSHGYGPSRGYGPSHGYRLPAYRPYGFGHPYYAFRPHTHIGFGVWLGFGVPYPYGYVASYPPPVYGYYQGRFCVVPNARVYGGISFDIAPAYAPVYVDDEYIGVASDFGPDMRPLTLVPGPHRIVVSVGGYRPLSWNVTVVAGQVIPFNGAIERY